MSVGGTNVPPCALIRCRVDSAEIECNPHARMRVYDGRWVGSGRSRPVRSGPGRAGLAPTGIVGPSAEEVHPAAGRRHRRVFPVRRPGSDGGGTVSDESPIRWRGRLRWLEIIDVQVVVGEGLVARETGR
jgi:hypothetical protein